MTDHDKETTAARIKLIIEYNCPQCREPKGGQRHCAAMMKELRPDEKCIREEWGPDK